MRAVALALVVATVTTGCQTTVRSRTTPAGIVEEAGRCDSEDVGPHEACTEQRRFDERKTVLGAAAVVAVAILAGILLTSASSQAD